MGIDVYLHWDGMTKEEYEKQLKGFDVRLGHLGYLREAYHGGPYITKMLFPEFWENEDTTISAENVIKQLYGAGKDSGHETSIDDDVVNNLGKPQPIVIDNSNRGHIKSVIVKYYIDDKEYNEEEQALFIKNAVLLSRIPSAVESAIKRSIKLYNSNIEEATIDAHSFIDFVILHKEKEDLGLNPFIIISK